jgi:hypothetical protein
VTTSKAGRPGRPLGDAEMSAQLDALPPGHPSSPWNEDGSRKPPPPRLRDMELPLPGAWRDYPEDGFVTG